ncbi:MAG: hypothetical protein RIK87_09170 [Fuerstiella sp.]
MTKEVLNQTEGTLSLKPHAATEPTTNTNRTTDGPELAAAREYRLRLASWRKRAKDARSTDRLFVRFRIVAFGALIAVASVCVGDPDVSLWWVLVPLTVFVLLLRIHAPILNRLRRAQASARFYEESLERLQGRWRHAAVDGAAFLDPQHPYASDLDIFGNGSLFQMINQCRTLPGQRKLAAWLTTVPDAQTVAERQRQTESLTEQLDLRESLVVIHDNVDWQAAEQTLEVWLTEEACVFPRWTLWGARLLGGISVIVLGLVLGGILSASFILLVLLLQGPFVLANKDRIRSVMDEVDSVDTALKQLAEVTRQFETFPLTEKSLQQLQQRLTADGIIASDRIAQLSSRIQWLNNALRNQFFMPVAWALGLFIHLPHRIERWRRSHGGRVREWLDAVTTLEVVTSVAGFNYEHEAWCLPQITEASREFTARQIGHPLLDPAACIRNDVTLTEQQPLMLISGSNMSGKSTLLRSVGTNLILAFCGARVNAESLRAWPFQIATAMRVSDSLQEGRSLFFTVVKRLKSVVDLTAQDRPVLFLLDEILSGTNSHDRRRGAEAVIRSLVERSALGMVTTHDLALTRIVESMDGRAVNMHFEDQVSDGQMTFDYQLRPGVVERSNAIELMRMMGLDV